MSKHPKETTHRPKRRTRDKVSPEKKLVSSQINNELLEAIESKSAENDALYDRTLLEYASSRWQLGDWVSLCKIDKKSLQHHPEKAKIALLVAVGQMQANKLSAAREFILLAQEWGCCRQLLFQLLISGLHISLGRAALANKQDQRAARHFESSIAVVTPEADAALSGYARAIRESVNLGLLPQAAKLLNEQLATLKHQKTMDKSRLTILETELGVLHNELSLAQQRQQLFSQNISLISNQFINGSPEWINSLKKKSTSQLGQDIWALERTGYKRGGFFVEFGATDGVLLSNTWLLEKEFEWQGICAEPNPKFYLQLIKNRSCIVSSDYIGRESGLEVEFILADVFGSALEFANNDFHTAKREAYRIAGQIITCTSISLNDFLKKHDAPRTIDYLSVDTEGSEYDLLSVFPFEEWDIRLITVEHNFTEQRTALRKLLESKGYCCNERQWDDWYEKIS